MFDRFEVNRVVGLDAGGNPTRWDLAVSVEADFQDDDQPPPAEAVRWTLYGHRTTGGVEAIADFEDRDEALAVYALLTSPKVVPSGAGDKIVIWREAGSWMGRWEGPHANRVRALLGSTTLPTAFTDEAKAETVRTRLAELNPGVQIIVAPDGRG